MIPKTEGSFKGINHWGYYFSWLLKMTDFGHDPVAVSQSFLDNL